MHVRKIAGLAIFGIALCVSSVVQGDTRIQVDVARDVAAVIEYAKQHDNKFMVKIIEITLKEDDSILEIHSQFFFTLNNEPHNCLPLYKFYIDKEAGGNIVPTFNCEDVGNEMIPAHIAKQLVVGTLHEVAEWVRLRTGLSDPKSSRDI